MWNKAFKLKLVHNMTWINDTFKMRIVANFKYENNGIFPSYFSTYHDFFHKIHDYKIFFF